MWLFTTLKAEHFEDVLEIEAASFQHPWRRQEFHDEFNRTDAQHYAVLTPADRRVIAYVFARIVSGQMHLLKIAVAPGWRRRGVAAWALGRCFATAGNQGVTSVVLEVRATNRAAIRLYAKLGFTRVRTRHRYYADTGEDALLMKKKINLNL